MMIAGFNMGCSSCGNKARNFAAPKIPTNNKPDAKKIAPVKNIIEAASKQANIFKWFRDGISGIAKCFTGSSLYTDEDIVKNRDVCRTCEHSTKDESGKLTIQSQCMGPDPEQNGAPCGCPIICKTQTGKCPLNKWTHITISANLKTEILHQNNVNIEI